LKAVEKMAIFYSDGFSFLRLFCRMRNRSLVSERESIGRSVGRSLGRKLLFVFPLTNAQLDLTKRKMSANVKHSEAMSDEIVTAMSTAYGASIFLFELFKKKPIKDLLS